ncbi:MAG: hypothetical protein CL843_16225 [Crocinitomicaceae bacterium]|nr:hypothetical protein [Crocinitomicaceae bacterium]|tara:strand:- start:31 stop:576 length:546 start_codon:yes stop_codon:yes gene_type:complete
MKNLLTAALLLLTVFTVQAQKKCKYNIDKEDILTGESLIGVSEKFLVKDYQTNDIVHNWWVLSIYKSSDDYYMTFEAPITGDTDYKINEGDSLLIGIRGQKPLVLFSKSEVMPLGVVHEGIVFTVYKIECSLTKEQLKLLAENATSAFIIHAGEKKWTFSYLKPERTPEKVRRRAECMLVL